MDRNHLLREQVQDRHAEPLALGSQGPLSQQDEQGHIRDWQCQEGRAVLRIRIGY